MPYIVTFSKVFGVLDSDLYINDCCIGGDVVLDRLLPALREKYGGLEANQEDWGWFAWFEQGHVKLAVDIFTEDFKTHQFQIFLTSRRPRFILGDKVEDGPELEALREIVVGELTDWSVVDLTVERVNEKYLPG